MSYVTFPFSIAIWSHICYDCELSLTIALRFFFSVDKFITHVFNLKNFACDSDLPRIQIGHSISKLRAFLEAFVRWDFRYYGNLLWPICVPNEAIGKYCCKDFWCIFRVQGSFFFFNFHQLQRWMRESSTSIWYETWDLIYIPLNKTSTW